MKSFVLFTSMSLLMSFSKGQTMVDVEAVKKVVNAFQDDFNDGGFKNALIYTTDDWEHINPLGGIDKGRENILKSVRSVHQTFLKGVTMKIETMDIRFPIPDLAIADVIHRVTSFTTPDGTKHENERHIKTYVIVKIGGKWLLTQDHNTVIQNIN